MQLELKVKLQSRPLVHSFRVDLNFTAVLSDKGVADGKPEADPL